MKIGVVGCAGRVGSALAFALLFQPSVDCIALNDIDRNKMAGELEDLEQASKILGKKVRFTANFDECDFIFICAGYARNKHNGIHDTNEELYAKNYPIMEMIFQWLAQKIYTDKTSVYIITNPDEMLAKAFSCNCLGKFLDDFRKENDKQTGLWILERKGFTNWGIVAEALRVINNEDEIKKV